MIARRGQHRTRGGSAYARVPGRVLAAPRWMVLCAVLSVAACGGSDNYVTGRFGTYASARVVGRVVSPTGEPLGDIAVAIHSEVRSDTSYVVRDGASYDLPNTMTNAAGAFDLTLNRVMERPGYTLPEPDTLTVMVLATAVRSQATPLPRNSAAVFVRFARNGQPAPVSTITLELPLP